MMTRTAAAAAVRMLSARYLSAPRMIAYFRRVWKTVGLDDAVWPERLPGPCESEGKKPEHYRRLTLDEIGRVYGCALKRAQMWADIVMLGYSTGLRLSDVVELERTETDLPFLRVCPNKTRYRKPRPLKIPLTESACAVVRRLLADAETKGRIYLFPPEARHRPSRKIVKLFRASGVDKEGTGRASFHSFRATYISLMDDAGVSPYVTDSITGHGGGSMHARYSQPSDQALLTAVARAIPDLQGE